MDMPTGEHPKTEHDLHKKPTNGLRLKATKRFTEF